MALDEKIYELRRDKLKQIEALGQQSYPRQYKFTHTIPQILTEYSDKTAEQLENPHKAKLMPYECGIDPVDNARGRYTVRFYIVAILFVVFDVEIIFLFPWAVQFKAFGLFGLLEMLIFLLILVVGYIWIWKKGALEWV